MRTGQLEHNCSLDDILAHLSETSFSAIPDDAAERTALITADIAACIVGGWKDRAAGETGDFVIENGGKEESTLWGRGKKVPAAQAAFACAVSARAFEFGVVDCDAPGAEFKPLHSAETLVPVALAVAEKSGSSGRDVLAALALGEDLAARLTAALDFSLPLDCRGTVNAVCSAAVAGKLLKLDEKRLRSAFGLVLHQLNGVRQGIHYSLGQGIAAHAGTSAALLASRGLLGVENMEDELAGLVHALGAAFDPAPLFRELGKSYFSSVTFKPYPCCRAAHGAVECGLKLLRQGLSPESIEHISLFVSPWAAGHIVARPFALRTEPHADAAYSLQYALAGTLLRGRCTPDCFTDEAISDPAVRELSGRISLHAEERPDGIFLSTRAEARTGDGNEYSAFVRIPRGNEHMGDALTLEEKKQKFTTNLSFGLSLDSRKAERIWEMFRKLKELDSLTPLAEAMRP